ncbi:hypothetical protein GCM10028781_13970 [Nostocoides australiense]
MGWGSPHGAPDRPPSHVDPARAMPPLPSTRIGEGNGPVGETDRTRRFRWPESLGAPGAPAFRSRLVPAGRHQLPLRV